jgi:hypothetical protein
MGSGPWLPTLPSTRMNFLENSFPLVGWIAVSGRSRRYRTPEGEERSCEGPVGFIGRVNAGDFAGQASFGRSASKTEWVYGFKVALVVNPEGVVSAFGLAPAASDERPIGDALIASDRYEAYLADKSFTGIEWERRWMEVYGALVAAAPKNNSRRAWSRVDRRWASGKRQIDHRRGDRPTQGLLLSGASSREDAG